MDLTTTKIHFICLSIYQMLKSILRTWHPAQFLASVGKQQLQHNQKGPWTRHPLNHSLNNFTNFPLDLIHMQNVLHKEHVTLAENQTEFFSTVNEHSRTTQSNFPSDEMSSSDTTEDVQKHLGGLCCLLLLGKSFLLLPTRIWVSQVQRHNHSPKVHYSLGKGVKIFHMAPLHLLKVTQGYLLSSCQTCQW